MLIDELKALAKRAEKTGCVVGVWLADQDPELREVLEDLKTKPSLNTRAVLNLIKDHNQVTFKETSFRDHMRGRCACQTV